MPIPKYVDTHAETRRLLIGLINNAKTADEFAYAILKIAAFRGSLPESGEDYQLIKIAYEFRGESGDENPNLRRLIVHKL